MLDSFQMCVDMISRSGYHACGPRFSRGAAGWCHFSGNFWWASCGHIRTLAPPFHPVLLQEEQANQGWAHDWPPYGRFYAEYWVLNGQKPRTAQGHRLAPFARPKGFLQQCSATVKVAPLSEALSAEREGGHLSVESGAVKAEPLLLLDEEKELDDY